MSRFTRTEILQRLGDQLTQGRPIVGAGSSSGLIAKSAAAGGADLIIVYNTGRTRLMGLATNHLLNHANPTTLSMYREVANAVTDTPIIGGAEAQDPTYWNDVDRLVGDYEAAGYDGLINFPTSFAQPDRNDVGLGLQLDFDMVRRARERDFFTICYGYTAEQIQGLAAAGADLVVPHAGWTTGGLAGAGKSAMTLEESCEHVQKLIELARRENPDIICLAHGGPLSSPEDLQYLYDTTDAQGFLGASSAERIPVERAVVETIEQFQSHAPRSAA